MLWISAIAIGSMPGERLVQQDVVGSGDEAAGDLEAPPLAARQREGPLLGEMLEAQLPEQAVEPLLALPAD